MFSVIKLLRTLSELTCTRCVVLRSCSIVCRKCFSHVFWPLFTLLLVDGEYDVDAEYDGSVDGAAVGKTVGKDGKKEQQKGFFLERV